MRLHSQSGSSFHSFRAVTENYRCLLYLQHMVLDHMHVIVVCATEKDDPSQKSSAIRARRKRDSRRSTGKITFDEVIQGFLLFTVHYMYQVLCSVM